LVQDIRAIWEQVRDGRPEAWRALVRIYAGLVHSVALRTGLSPHDAEDCAQQTWIALYRRRLSIKDPKSLPSWLIRTTHRRAVRMARRYAQFTELEASEQMQDPARLPDKLLEQWELEAHLEFALGQLDRRCERLLRSLFLSEAVPSYRELARLLGVKSNSFGPLRSRCLHQLRQILEKMGYAPD